MNCRGCYHLMPIFDDPKTGACDAQDSFNKKPTYEYALAHSEGTTHCKTWVKVLDIDVHFCRMHSDFKLNT